MNGDNANILPYLEQLQYDPAFVRLLKRPVTVGCKRPVAGMLNMMKHRSVRSSVPSWSLRPCRLPPAAVKAPTNRRWRSRR